jgi:hypothetical protein
MIKPMNIGDLLTIRDNPKIVRVAEVHYDAESKIDGFKVESVDQKQAQLELRLMKIANQALARRFNACP